MSDMSPDLLLPRPSDNPVQAPFWAAAARGALAFQRCTSCRHAFLPGRQECPNCLSAAVAWETASGKATLVSWIVYHRAYQPPFATRLPYTVAIVELEEGARMITNIVGIDDPEALEIDQPLILKVEEDGGIAVPRFTPADR
jgi:hypothetical protein